LFTKLYAKNVFPITYLEMSDVSPFPTLHTEMVKLLWKILKQVQSLDVLYTSASLFMPVPYWG